MKGKFSNPLRYPGSKSGFIEEFSEYVKTNNLIGKEIVEPYAGSASISLGLLQKGMISSAILFERDPLIFAFWHSVFNRRDELVNAIEDLPITLDTWYEFDKFRQMDGVDPEHILSLGLAGLFFNRTNFSGVLHAGPIGGKSQLSDYAVDCRFNKKDIIKRIVSIAKMAGQVSVFFGDAIDALKDANNADNANRFFYVDPPYYKQGRKLYRYHYKLSDHKRLADALSEANYRWILSYDNHHVIEHFYADFDKITRDFRYSSRSPKQEKELLITNIDGWIQPATFLTNAKPQDSKKYVTTPVTAIDSNVNLPVTT